MQDASSVRCNIYYILKMFILIDKMMPALDFLYKFNTLKSMTTHYETLGVAESATPAEIQQAYRKLAMKWHPDKNKGDKAAEEKFKQINEANETLSDDSKRQMYDRQRGGGPQGGFGGMHSGFGGPMDDIINQMFSQHGFNVFRSGNVQNRDMTMSMNISLEDAWRGKQVPVQYATPSGRNIELMINIPSGVESGLKIRYQGQGDHANASLPPGDLYVVIIIADHPIYRRSGTNIESLIKIDAITAIVGGKIKVNCIDGSSVEVVIPPDTQLYSKIRVSGKGMPLHPGYKDYGDMILVAELKLPTNLTQGQIDVLKNIQSQRGLDIA